jgi:hypothetical protein
MFFFGGGGDCQPKGGGGFLGPKDKPDSDCQHPYLTIPFTSQSFQKLYNFAKLLTLLYSKRKKKNIQHFVLAKLCKHPRCGVAVQGFHGANCAKCGPLAHILTSLGNKILVGHVSCFQ